VSQDWIHLGGNGPVAAIIEVREGHALDAAALEAASTAGIIRLHPTTVVQVGAGAAESSTTVRRRTSRRTGVQCSRP